MRLKWKPFDSDSPLKKEEERLESILQSWKGTPYLQQSMSPGVGVDCVRFACCALDAAYGIERVPTKFYPADQSMHNRKSAMSAMKWIIKRYEPNHRVDFLNEPIEPFDLVVSGPINGGPGHAMIAGVMKPQLWHIPGRRRRVTARSTSFKGDKLFKVFAVFRCSDREEKWLKS